MFPQRYRNVFFIRLLANLFVAKEPLEFVLAQKKWNNVFAKATDHCSLIKIEPVKDNYQKLIESSQDKIADFLADLLCFAMKKALIMPAKPISFEEKEDIARDLSEVLNEWLNNKEVAYEIILFRLVRWC